MSKKTQSGPLQVQLDDVIREEALKIARATQAPGQTKEQTKLIAKGIAKGIAEYKKQEKVKQRERTKLRKKSKPADNTGVPGHREVSPEPSETNLVLAELPELTAASIFLLVSILHLLRMIFRTELTIGSFPVPLYWSGLASLAALLLSVWIYRAGRRTARRDHPSNPE